MSDLNKNPNHVTALNNLVPAQKQLFNLPNQPVEYSELKPSEVKGMVQDLINSLNNNISHINNSLGAASKNNSEASMLKVKKNLSIGFKVTTQKS